MNIIEVKKLSVKYNEHIALKNINMTVKEKEYICLVGKNGSGKSTLLKTITGLIKKESGKVEFKINRGDVSYLAQNNLTDISFPATAKEIIMTGTQKHGIKPFYTKKDEEKLKEVVKELKIENLLNKKIGDPVKEGESLLTIYSNTKEISSVQELLYQNIQISDSAEKPTLIHDIITE